MNNEPSENVVISVSEAQLESMMQRAVRRAFDDVGLTIEDKDDRNDAREDFRFLRFLRRAVYGGASKIAAAFIIVFVGALAVALWAGFRAQILKQ